MFDSVELGPHDVVLDLGCGDARWVVAAALRGCTARGLDLNEDLLQKGHRATAKAGVSIRWNRSSRRFFRTVCTLRQVSNLVIDAFSDAFSVQAAS